jgi:hypothetical protein
MKKVQIIIGIILLLMIPISYAEQLELFSVAHLKGKKIFSLYAWSSKKSKALSLAELIEKLVFTNPKKQADHYGKLIQTPIPKNLKARIGMRRHVFSAQRLQHFKLSCQGSKSNKWHLKMNIKTKRMWVKLKNAHTYNIPIIYSRWSNDSRKRILVVAGRGKKYVKATIWHRNCRLDFSKHHYAYSISAKIAHTNHLSGCCSATYHE